MTLEEIRNEIDEIDSQLLPLFIKRMHCSEQVARIKAEQHLPVLNTEREKEILESIADKAEGFGGEAKVLYSTIMGISRALQNKMLGSGGEIRNLVNNAPFTSVTTGKNIACPGVPGAYSHEAAQELFPDCNMKFYTTFHDVFKAIESGEADFGLVPVENSSAGSVSEVYDYILNYRFYIVGAATLHIHHCLAVTSGTTMEDIQTVYSHPQALAQCSDYLSANGWKAQEFSNTAAAAKMVAQKANHSIAAICSKAAANEYGLQILNEDIQNSSTNCTRFIAISRELFIPDNAQKISLCFSLPHTTGSLYSVLARFAMSGLNLTKIESRPIAAKNIVGKNFEYDFYLDFTGNVRDPKTLDLLCALCGELPRFSFLGNYMEQE
jgi:chorismate mutase/prephenate dehydratase